MEKILLIDKPAGITSFDVIAILRKRLGIKKIGHAGTLDPKATGLLIVGVGTARKKLKNFVHLPKTYIADILFGKKTATSDLEGEVLEEREVSRLNVKKLEKVLKDMEGEIKLQVPAYSAVKVAGKPLYKYARKKMEVKTPVRTRHIYNVKFLRIEKVTENNKNFVVARIEIEVESGTYIRSVAEEIGKRLGLPATLYGLRRVKIGNFKVENATQLNEI